MNKAYLNQMWGKKLTIVEAVKHLAEHPKATFYSRIDGKELKIVTENGVSRFAELTEKSIEIPDKKPKETKEPEKEEKPTKEPEKEIKAPSPKTVKITPEEVEKAKKTQ